MLFYFIVGVVSLQMLCLNLCKCKCEEIYRGNSEDNMDVGFKVS